MKTIKDIAEEAKVSPGTVDRVIHNRPGVSPKTKEKIQNILKKHKFQRNVLASTLAFKKKYKIATLIPSSQSKKDFWYEPNRGLKTAIEEIKIFGFEIHTFYFDKFDLDSYSNAFDGILKLNPNGVLFAPFFRKTSTDFAKKLDDKKIPYVFINIDIEFLNNLSFIGQDNFKSGFLAGKLLNMILNDKDHIMVVRSIKNVDNHNAIDFRIKGFLGYFREKDIIRNIEQINIMDIESIENIKETLDLKLKLGNLIKGIFVPSSSGYKVAKALENNSCKDIHLLGFDAHTDNSECLNRETIDFLIDQNPFEQGYIGLKILFEYLLFNKVPLKKYNSPIHLITKENVDCFRHIQNPDVNEYAYFQKTHLSGNHST